ncbi:MAG: tetratricopeptide repeat protein, partial [Planctomycetaceae bacterium]|nr:tetratricopeptide repeat protein [Planctomycetaceae bacterium]
AAAGLWVAHPLTTESVTYLIQRSEALAACGMLATLCLWNLGCRSEHRASLWLSLSLMTAFLAAASKPTAVVLPVLVILYDRLLLAASWTQLLRRRGIAHLLVWLPTLWILWDVSGTGLLTAPETTAAPSTATAGLGAAGLTSWEYLRSQFGVLLHYLWLILTGTSQSLDYGRLVTERVDIIIGSAFLVSMILAGCLLSRRRWPGVALLGLSYFVLLVPTSSVIPLRDLLVEHRVYLPSAAVITLLVTSALALAAWGNKSPSSAVRRGVVAAICLCLMMALGRTIARNADYHDELRLWTRAVAATPQSPRAYTFLAEILLRRNQAEEAIAILEHAKALYEQQTGKPAPTPIERANAHSLLGSAYETAGRRADAEAELRRAVELSPAPVFLTNLGAVVQRAGDLDAAEGLYRQALAADGNTINARVNLGRLLLQRGQAAAAVEILEPLRDSVPRTRPSLTTLAEAYQHAQRLDEADAVYRQLLQEQLADGNTFVAWGKLHRARGEYQSAHQCFIEAARRSPRDPWPLALQAEMLARLGNAVAADQLAAQVLQQLPADSIIAQQLQALRASLNQREARP